MTISATGNRAFRGFTVLEVLLVLFLIALIGTIFVVNIDSILRDREEAGVERAFWDATHEARLQALFLRKPVSLFFDEENSAFQLMSGETLLKSFPTAAVTHDGERIVVEFVQQRATNEMVLVRGQLVDTRPIREVSFYPDGSCTTFWVQLHYGSETRQIQIDPWTGAEILAQDR